MDYAVTDDTISQHSGMSEQMSLPQQQQLPQQSNNLQQQMDPMQSIPWAGAGPDGSFSGNMLHDISVLPPVSTGIAGDCPTVIDPMLWPPVTSSEALGQPMLNSWTGLMGEQGDGLKHKPTFPLMGWLAHYHVTLHCYSVQDLNCVLFYFCCIYDIWGEEWKWFSWRLNWQDFWKDKDTHGMRPEDGHLGLGFEHWRIKDFSMPLRAGWLLLTVRYFTMAANWTG
jgi:hypothetical protein